MSDQGEVRSKERGPVGRLVEDGLVGVVEMIARALAKGAESITSDLSKVTGRQKRKIDVVAEKIKTWREINVGEISDEDVPSELRD